MAEAADSGEYDLPRREGSDHITPVEGMIATVTLAHGIVTWAGGGAMLGHARRFSHLRIWSALAILGSTPVCRVSASVSGPASEMLTYANWPRAAKPARR